MEARAGSESRTPISAYLSLLAQLASSTQGQPDPILQAIAQLVLDVLRGHRRERLLVLGIKGRGRHRESFNGSRWGGEDLRDRHRAALPLAGRAPVFRPAVIVVLAVVWITVALGLSYA